ERPRAIERRRPEIVGIPAHGIAGGIAYPAIDAFDGGIGGDARRAVRPDWFYLVVAGLRWLETPPRPRPLVGESADLVGQIFDDGQICERSDLEAAALGHARHVRAAGPARSAVHRHGAGAAHADAAGKAVGQRRVEMALNERHDIEHGLVFAP